MQLWVTGQQGSGVVAMCKRVAAMGNRASRQQVCSHRQRGFTQPLGPLSCNKRLTPYVSTRRKLLGAGAAVVLGLPLRPGAGVRYAPGVG